MGECNFMSERVINKLVNVLKKFTSCSLEKEIYLYSLVNFYDFEELFLKAGLSHQRLAHIMLFSAVGKFVPGTSVVVHNLDIL